MTERIQAADQSKARVLLLETIHPDAVTRLESAGHQVNSVGDGLGEVELIGAIAGVQLLGIRSKSQVTAKVLKAADSLTAIDAFCIGTDQIDLAGAAVDVFPQEPKGRRDEFVSKLGGSPNVILSPHIGGSTEEAQSEIGGFVASKLVPFVEGGNPTLSVNLPAVALPEQSGKGLIVHVHSNTSGVLAKVNNILAEHSVNVEGQCGAPAASTAT